ncbi:hypothetical protein FTUN_1870 [Frigoriglobus tundricola]|uniref:Uncharacterized protein n=1 Tax=Frigoriglobus tundricola TaxID=2774151 RepID=A0A6M5YLX0_9BACT|nr:hypothetical protein FTUN_1870 [Frigoriglobus tundricola]
MQQGSVVESHGRAGIIGSRAEEGPWTPPAFGVPVPVPGADYYEL